MANALSDRVNEKLGRALEARGISYGDPRKSQEERDLFAQGLQEGYINTAMELPMAAYEYLAPDAGYTPGELRSSPQDKLRGERFAWEQYMAEQAENPAYAQGEELGTVSGYAFDPFLDTSLALAPGVAAGRVGKAVGDLGQFGAEAMARRVSTPERGIMVGGDIDDALIAQHNLSAANLAHAEKMGGIPVPSLAVTKAADPMTNFGEISLLAEKGLIDPRGGAGAKVFGADVYSPRYPNIDYKTSRKGEERLKERLDRYEAEVGANWSDYPDVADRGRDAIENSPLVMAEFLDSIGESIPKAREKNLQGKSTKKIDSYGTKNKMRKKIASKHHDQFQDHIDGIMYDVVEEERIFQGYSPSGTRKYKPHTLENVTKEMKKNIRGGESFNYGPGSLRAQFTPEFKSIKQIKDASGRLVNKESFDKMKDEISDDMFALYEDMKPYMKHQSDNQFINYDQFQDQIGEVSSLGINRMINEYFPDAPRDGVANFVSKLADFPTEYFESNILRSVGIDEFSAAVVPTGTPQGVIDSLKAKGLNVKKYKRGDDSARKAVINSLKKLHFSVLPAAMIEEEKTNALSAKQ